MLKEDQSSALLLRSYLLHLQRWRSNALFVQEDTVTLLSLLLSLSLSCLLRLLNVTSSFPSRQAGGNSDAKRPAYALSGVRACVVLSHHSRRRYISISSGAGGHPCSSSRTAQRSSVGLGAMNQVAGQAERLTVAAKTNTSSPLWKNQTL